MCTETGRGVGEDLQGLVCKRPPRSVAAHSCRGLMGSGRQGLCSRAGVKAAWLSNLLDLPASGL